MFNNAHIFDTHKRMLLDQVPKWNLHEHFQILYVIREYKKYNTYCVRHIALHCGTAVFNYEIISYFKLMTYKL